MKKAFFVFACTLLANCLKAQLTDKSTTLIDTLLISRDDNRFFETEFDLANTLKFKEVARISDSSKTVSIKLTFNEGSGAMLKIYNPFSVQLVYKAELYSYKKKDYLETSTVPVYSKLFAYETWPYKIDKIRLTGFKLVKE